MQNAQLKAGTADYAVELQLFSARSTSSLPMVAIYLKVASPLVTTKDHIWRCDDREVNVQLTPRERGNSSALSGAAAVSKCGSAGAHAREALGSKSRSASKREGNAASWVGRNGCRSSAASPRKGETLLRR